MHICTDDFEWASAQGISYQQDFSIKFVCLINKLKITKLESVGGEGRQSTVRGSTVNSEAINDQQ